MLITPSSIHNFVNSTMQGNSITLVNPCCKFHLVLFFNGVVVFFIFKNNCHICLSADQRGFQGLADWFQHSHQPSCAQLHIEPLPVARISRRHTMWHKYPKTDSQDCCWAAWNLVWVWEIHRAEDWWGGKDWCRSNKQRRSRGWDTKSTWSWWAVPVSRDNRVTKRHICCWQTR
jgi:hypothetical protein